MADERLRDAGRFAGARLNVEAVPRLPAWTARWALEDPRQRPYLVLWRKQDGCSNFDFAVRLEPLPPDRVRAVYADGGIAHELALVPRPLPGGYPLLLWRCPGCGRARRFLYLFRLDSAKRGVYGNPPACAPCSSLRWYTQGRYMSRLLREVYAAVELESGQRPRAIFPRYVWDPAAAVTDPGRLASGSATGRATGPPILSR